MKYFIFLLFLGTVHTIYSQETIKRNYITGKTNGQIITVDGKFDEPAWEKAIWENKFVQFQPYEGKEPLKKTEFAVLYDKDNLYVGIKAFDNPDSISMRMTRRDELDGDLVSIMLDSYFDKRTGFSFTVSAAGVKSDDIMSNDGENQDNTWDPIWWVKTGKTASGWNAEMRIPLTQLRFEHSDNQKWGFQVLRYIFRKDEVSVWQPTKRSQAGFVSQFGELTGIEGIKPRKTLDLMPYAVARTSRFEKEPGNPFRETGKKSNLDAGLDAKIGLTNNFTLDATINPDFGQVEADPSEVNLTTYETFFPEKRPFFIEGKNILTYRLSFGDGDLSYDGLFYSRRIGKRPSLSPDVQNNEYSNTPDFTRILGAAKITGKTQSGWSAGFLESVTAEENALIKGLNTSRKEIVEPLTNYFAGRIQKDFNKGNTYLGGMITSVNRHLDDKGIDFLHKSAYTGGLDFVHKWHNKDWIIDAGLFFSNVNGSKEAISRTQLAYIHNFRRPDATYLKFDPSRTSLNGYGGKFMIGKVGGKFKIGSIWAWKSPGLELNDIGYAQQVDNIFQILWAGYRFYEPFSIFRELNINFNQWSIHDFGGNLNTLGANVNFNTQFKNYWRLFSNLNLNVISLDITALRGGPALRTPGETSLFLGLMSNPQKKFTVQLNSRHGFSFEKNYSKNFDYNLILGYRPLRSLKIDFLPGLNLTKDEMQYVSQQSYTNKYSYVFARIDRKTVNLSVRLNYNITPDLTIQYWGQPFVATGRYTAFKTILNSKARELQERFSYYNSSQIKLSKSGSYQIDDNGDNIIDFEIGNPDFNVREFLSNLVIRWEYRPGSTLYLVWSQNRSGYVNNGIFNFNNDFDALFRQHANDIFQVKLSYRLGR